MKRPCTCNRVTSPDWSADQCRLCWLTTYDERYQKLFGVKKNTGIKSVKIIRRDNCLNLGKVLDRGSCNCPAKWVRQCEKHGTCRTGPSADGVPSCLGCNDYDPDGAEPPPAGVVIGSYNLPKLVALQIKLIRDMNGPNTPILIADDCSPGTARTPQPWTIFGELSALARENPGVTLWSNPERYGHAGGDLASYYVGLQWAAVHQLKYLVKLSQRLLIDIPLWLYDVAEGMNNSGQPTGCNPCREGHSVFPLRTEAIIFDVAKWHRPDVLDHLRPRPVTGIAAEIILWDDMTDRVGAGMWRWPIMNTDRAERCPGVIWHCSHQYQDYKAIAERYGMKLDEHFTTAGWQSQSNYKW